MCFVITFVKMYNTFKSEGINKPLLLKCLFGKHFKIECNKNGTKFLLNDYYIAWQNLPNEEKDKFKKQYDDDKAKYTAEYVKQRSNAIKNGIIPPDKPTRPATAFFKFLAEVRPSLTKKYANDKNRMNANSQIVIEASAMWNSLYDEEKAKYNLNYKEAIIVYENQMKEWQLYENIRQGLPLDENMIKLLMKKSEERTNLRYEIIEKTLHPDRVSK